MRALITGGAGFIGSTLADRLLELGHERVVIVDDLSNGKREYINPKAEFLFFDICNPRLYEQKDVFENIDVIFHLAARARVQPSIQDPISFNETNVDGTLRLLKAAVDYNINKFVFSSSSSVYGNVEVLPTSEDHSLNPLSPYGAQKLIGEVYCKQFYETYGLQTVCLRYFNVYGERQAVEGAYSLVMGKFIQQRINGEPMTIRGDGEQKRDFTYVGDVVDANILAAVALVPWKGECINVGNGDNRSVNQIADLVGGPRVHVDPVIEPYETLADNSLAKHRLGWFPEGNIDRWMKDRKRLGLA